VLVVAVIATLVAAGLLAALLARTLERRARRLETALGEVAAGNLAVYRVEMEPMGISSREIRRRIGAGEPVEALVTPAVLGYIGRRGLYRSGGS
jgi:nicotinic acid mononucleotide adenylyltransferase